MEVPPSVFPSELFVNRSALEKHFECLICYNIQKDPVTCLGGHGFCRGCIVDWKRQSSSCPTCQVSLDTLVPQLAVESNILDQLVYCYTRLPSLNEEKGNDDEDDENNNSSSGSGGGKRKVAGSSSSKKAKARIDHCTWQGMLKDATEHFRHCAFAGAKCEFEGCDVVMARSELGEHRVVCTHRTSICRFNGCVQLLKAAEMEQHQLICPRRTVKCPNADAGCRLMIFYERLAQHRAECLYQLCPCPFSDVGCTARMLRNEIEKHEQDNSVQHNRLLLKNAQEQRQAIASMKDHLMPETEKIVLRVKHVVLTGKEPFVPKFSHEPSRYYSVNYLVKGYTTSLYIQTAIQDHYGLYLEVRDGPFPCKLEFTFEVEHHDGKATSVVKRDPATTPYDCATAKGVAKLISKADVAAPDSPYVKDGYVTFKVTFKFV